MLSCQHHATGQALPRPYFGTVFEAGPHIVTRGRHLGTRGGALIKVPPHPEAHV